MSYDVKMVNEKGNLLVVPRHTEGGTYMVGGTNLTELNITYNYAPHFCKVLGELGIRSLYGKKGREVQPLLRKAVKKLGTERDGDYWKSTPGNAGHALNILLQWAILHPYGIFQGD